MASRWLVHPILAIGRLFLRRIAPEDVTGIWVLWRMPGQTVLAMSLFPDVGADCTGSGTLDTQDGELFVGVTDPGFFERVRALVTSDLLKWIGRRRDSEPKGAPCLLKIDFRFAQGRERSIVLTYGANSLTVLAEISRFVFAAKDLASPWHEEFRDHDRESARQTSEPSDSKATPV